MYINPHSTEILIIDHSDHAESIAYTGDYITRDSNGECYGELQVELGPNKHNLLLDSVRNETPISVAKLNPAYIGVLAYNNLKFKKAQISAGYGVIPTMTVEFTGGVFHKTDSQTSSQVNCSGISQVPEVRGIVYTKGYEHSIQYVDIDIQDGVIEASVQFMCNDNSYATESLDIELVITNEQGCLVILCNNLKLRYPEDFSKGSEYCVEARGSKEDFSII